MAYQFEFEAPLWRWKAETGTAWHFLTLPNSIADEIKLNWGNLKAGWGSIRVAVQVKATQWNTSIFPDKKSGSYLLPVKAAVRNAEKLTDGQSVRCVIWIDG